MQWKCVLNGAIVSGKAILVDHYLSLREADWEMRELIPLYKEIQTEAIWFVCVYLFILM